MNLVIVVWLLTLSTPLSTPVRHGGPMRECPDSTTFFEFQVVAAGGKPTRWIEDTALAVYPVPATRNPANLVQFVVDTAGVPVARSFHPLKVTDTAVVAAARQSLAQWRFTPAVRDGCKVRQLIQTPIGR
jgi:hypothetical protein